MSTFIQRNVALMLLYLLANNFKSALSLDNLNVRTNPAIVCECEGFYTTIGDLKTPFVPAGSSPGYFHFYTGSATRRVQTTIITDDVTYYSQPLPTQLVIGPNSPPLTSREAYYAGQPTSTTTGSTKTCINGGYIDTETCINCTFDGVPVTTCGLAAFDSSASCNRPTNISCLLNPNTTTVIVSGLDAEDLSPHPKLLFEDFDDDNWSGSTKSPPKQLCTVTKKNKNAAMSFSEMVEDGYSVVGTRVTKRGVKEVFQGIFSGIKEVVNFGLPIVSRLLPALLGKRDTDSVSETNYENAVLTGSTSNSAMMTFDEYDPVTDIHDLTGDDDYEDLLHSDPGSYTQYPASLGATLMSSWGSRSTTFTNSELNSAGAEIVSVVGDDSVSCVDFDTQTAVLSKIGSCFTGGGCSMTTSCVNNGPMPIIKLTENDMENLKDCVNDFACRNLRMESVLAEALEEKDIDEESDFHARIRKTNYFFWALDAFQGVLWVFSAFHSIFCPPLRH